VTNVPGVVVTPVTTGVVIGVPFRNGTVSKGPTVPGLLTLVNTIVPELLVVVVPLGLKANRAAGGALFGIDWLTATVARLGLFDAGEMPLIFVVGRVTLAPPFPGGAVTLTPVPAVPGV